MEGQVYHGKKNVLIKDNYENVVGKIMVSPVQPQKVHNALTREMPLSQR